MIPVVIYNFGHVLTGYAFMIKMMWSNLSEEVKQVISRVCLAIEQQAPDLDLAPTDEVYQVLVAEPKPQSLVHSNLGPPKVLSIELSGSKNVTFFFSEEEAQAVADEHHKNHPLTSVSIRKVTYRQATQS